MEITSDFNIWLFVVVGVLIVFTALAIISAAIAVIRRLDAGWQTKEKEADEAAFGKDQTIDNTTLVLIIAAVSTMIQGRFHIQRVRRLMPSDSPGGGWSAHGRAILHGSHVVQKKRPYPL